MLESKRILVIITGSIAAYKSLELIRLLTKAGATVEGVLTRGGAAFITPLSVATLTGTKAHLEMWDDDASKMPHIELSRNADLIVAAPATADFIAKMARGIGDDLASTVLLARNKPVILAPSMNVEMWENPAFRRNLDLVQKDGARVIAPQTDVLACGESGFGKMAEPESIFDAIQEHFERSYSLKGKRAIVTAGGTIERIDSVRYISNFSSGKQGFAISEALADAGAEVELIAGNTTAKIPLHPRINVTTVESAKQMKQVVDDALPSDIFVGCAAVCDFRVSNRADRKIKKDDGLELEFELNPDIIASIGSLPRNQRPQLVIGFAAETNNVLGYAKKKLESKSCDLIVANDVSEGAVFGRDENEVHFVSKDEILKLAKMSKSELSRSITDWIVDRLACVSP